MSANTGPHSPSGVRAGRPTVRSLRGVVSSGHLLSSLAGLDILRRGGNAVDAGVAAGICLNVVHHDLTMFSGVAPIAIFLADSRRIVTISGVGRWPRGASLDHFLECQGGRLVEGLAHAVMPAAADAWTTALGRYGTMSLAQVMESAIGHARDGFPVHDVMARGLADNWDYLCGWPGSRAVAGPEGRPLGVGEVMVQPDLARTLERMADEERASSGSREERIRAARDRFYRGDIGQDFLDFSREHGGFFCAGDFDQFEVQEEPAAVLDYKGYQVVTCGPWCQGPVLLQALSILQHFDLQTMGHNSARYIHTVVESLNLALADREFYYGDPEFVDVPLAELLSPGYGSSRAGLIRPQQAWGELPPPGDPVVGRAQRDDYHWPPPGDLSPGGPRHAGQSDTSYVCVFDGQGNMFSATPSDSFVGPLSPPIIPGVGLAFSARGKQSRLDPGHPSVMAPWKRPRLTPSPALLLRDGSPVMAFGTPGADIQPQAMLQALLNILEFGMSPQEAVEVPRFGTFSHPGSFYPHTYSPGLLRVEDRVSRSTLACLERLGHRVVPWPAAAPEAGSVCIAGLPLAGRILQAAADRRREAVALGW